MSVFLCVVVALIWFSYASARDRLVPWFSLGGTSKRRKAPAPTKFRLRTENIKPKSPWLKSKPPPFSSGVSFPRLDELTHSAETSRRLVKHMQQMHPDKSLQWCVEKAIYDIERDRMAR